MKKEDRTFLPIGSIVMLQDAIKPVMVTGYAQIDKNTGVMYDYTGCLYPEGIVDATSSAVFNADKIDKILFVGYKTVEWVNYVKQAKKVLKSMK